MNARHIWPPVPQWSTTELSRFGGRVLLLTAVAYLVIRVPEVGLAGLGGDAAPYWLGKLLLDVLVLGYVAARARWTGPKLVGALAVVYVGLQVVSFVEIYLYGMITWPDMLAWTGGSLLQGAAIVALVVVGFSKLWGEEAPVPDERLQFPPAEWAWKLLVLAVVFLVLMIVAGLVVFEGIAGVVDPQARAGYEIVEPPAWILPFQLVRGTIFTMLLIPIVYLFDGGVRETQGTVALLFATLLASNMIVGYDSVPGLLWMAHFFELFLQAFVFGLLAVWLLSRRHHPLQTLRGRIGLLSEPADAAD